MTQFGELYEAIVDDEAFAALPAMVARHVGTRSVTIQAFASDWSLLYLTYCHFTSEMADFYRARELQHHDLWSAALIATASQGAQIGIEIVSEDNYRKSIFYNEFFRHFGDDTGKFVGFGAVIGDRLMTVGAHRPFGDKPFEEADRQRMQEIVPHLRRIYAARFALDTAKTRVGMADAISDTFAVPAVVTDCNARLVHANEAGFALIQRGNGIKLAPGDLLVAERHDATLHLRALIAEACLQRASHGGAIQLERTSGKPALRLSVMPSPGQLCHAVILFDDPAAIAPVPASTLKGLFGLTHAEAEVAIMLGEGLTPAMIAEARGVSTATVRFQVQQCLRKTETSRHGELIRLVNRLPGRPG